MECPCGQLLRAPSIQSFQKSQQTPPTPTECLGEIGTVDNLPFRSLFSRCQYGIHKSAELIRCQCYPLIFVAVCTFIWPFYILHN